MRLVLRVEDERFRPEWVDVIWGVPDGAQRRARIPAQGSLPTTGTEIGSVLITLSEGDYGSRRFVVRGYRGESNRISGASGLLPYRGATESTLTLTLVDCYDDPGEPKLPGCPATTDGGVDNDAGRDTSPDNRPADAGADRPPG